VITGYMKINLFLNQNFNNQIDEYYVLISKYDELIFSNYDDLNILLETKNN
jgi:hypothetical protein